LLEDCPLRLLRAETELRADTEVRAYSGTWTRGGRSVFNMSQARRVGVPNCEQVVQETKTHSVQVFVKRLPPCGLTPVSSAGYINPTL
jgi:hypothetical protein